jgi:hypothetical protein
MAGKSAKRREPPTIELYMYSLNQEFPAGKGHETYLKRHSEAQEDLRGSLVLKASVESQVFQTRGGGAVDIPPDWSVKWLSNRWIQNDVTPMRADDPDPLRTAVLRKEDFGAILFEPRSDRVYKLNKTGAELFEKLRKLALSGDRSFEKVAGFEPEEVGPFVSMLKAAGLWGGV